MFYGYVLMLDDWTGHVVLVVRTTMGDLALDNQHDRVLPLEDTGYLIMALLP